MQSTTTKKVLVIEDDPNTASLIAIYLEREGFEPIKASDGETGLALSREHRPMLVILDLMLPRMDGWEVCRRLRQHTNIPVIMLTARGDEIDRVAGLTMGADDYVVKPFSPRELVARVQAVLRRTLVAEMPDTNKHLVYGDLVLDLEKRRLDVDSRPVDLTPHEFTLLAALMASPGKAFSRDELIDKIYPQGDTYVVDRVVDVHIGKLRHKIEPQPSAHAYIQTVRGVGYRFADAPAPSGKGRR